MMCNKRNVAKDALLGTAGGLVGTAALWVIDGAIEKWAPSLQAPFRLEPGPYIVRQPQRMFPDSTWAEVPERVETAAAAGLSFSYGAFFGAIYGALRPKGGSSLIDGAILGIACWAAGYLGWLPVAGLLPPIWKQKPGQIAGPIVQHALYGMAAVGAYDLVKEHASV